jgi:uncharacterized protein involved in exopolysaccharide biosynthesis
VEGEYLAISEIGRSVQEREPVSRTLRDLAAVGFRHGRLIAIVFFGVLIGGTLAGLFLPSTYESEMKLLVQRERVDPLVSAQPTAPPQPSRGLLTEEELNSEVELLQSQDLLEKVVITLSLHEQKSGSAIGRLFSNDSADQPRQVAEAVRSLKDNLTVAALEQTNLISVKYRASDPQRAAQVLKAMANLYLEKHLAVHRPAGQFQFFEQQAEEYRKKLDAAEAQLATFTREKGTVSAQMERDISLQKLSEFEAGLQQTRAQIAETRDRIAALEKQAADAPERLITQISTDANARLLQELKSTLLTLELQRTELLSKFTPTYRPVQEVEAKIAQTRAAITAAETNPLSNEVTDRDPTYEWIRAELAKARSELKALEARATATTKTIAAYRENSRRLNQQGIAQQELLRSAKAYEENYLLYLRKREEARITDEMDKRGILNVAVAEEATAPSLPSSSPWLYAVSTFLLAILLSVGSALVADYLDPSFRTPDEVRAILRVPVLAAVPAGVLEGRPLLLSTGDGKAGA